MGRLDLARLLRGPHGRAVVDLLPLLEGPVHIEGPDGRVLLGAPAGGARHEILAGDAVVGVVVGGAGAERIARLVGHLYDREEEKLALATETLGRYKELTILYDMSNALSRVLEVDGVSRRIVDEAHRFLRSRETTLFTLDRRASALEPLASAGESSTRVDVHGDGGLEARVLRTGQAELVEMDERGGSVVAAPLRFGDAVFGLLRATSQGTTRWGSGDLKLVTSLAALAATAVSHALLHRDRLRQQAIYTRLERFISPDLLQVAAGERPLSASDGVVALVCDAADVVDEHAGTPPQDVLARALGATSVALDALVEHGAIVGTTQGETLVAFFAEGAEFARAAARAVAAATALARRLGARGPSVGPRAMGIGLARVQADAAEHPGRFYAGLGVAALLHTAAQGRVLCDAMVAAALPPDLHVAIEPIPGPDGDVAAHEVRP